MQKKKKKNIAINQISNNIQTTKTAQRNQTLQRHYLGRGSSSANNCLAVPLERNNTKKKKSRLTKVTVMPRPLHVLKI